MKFFFPDSQDQIDPSFNFDTETRNRHRLRQRDDEYAHEALVGRPYDGMLISKPQVDGTDTGAGRYTRAMRNRFYREGVQRFLRLEQDNGPPLLAMGDNGAFSYADEEVPPWTPDETIDFYELGGFDLGLSLDHVVLGFTQDGLFPEDVDSTWKFRHQLTIDLAAEFKTRHSERKCSFTPIGVAQGWSPLSYAEAVTDLQKIGYRRLALGGMVSLKTPQILQCLREISRILNPGVEIHLLGVTRTDHMSEFATLGVTSFDSTSPFRRAFMDQRANYWTSSRTYIALRVPQVSGNPSLKRRIASGEIDQDEARTLEQNSLRSLAKFDEGEATVEEVVDALRTYERLWDGKNDRSDLYREVLQERPWKECRCGLCQSAGIHVAIFRGAERNKRRGFHNVWVFGNEMRENVEGKRVTT